MRDGGAESGQREQTGGEKGARARGCQFTFQTLHSTSQEGLSLEFVAATVGRECNIQDARHGGLWLWLRDSVYPYAGSFKFIVLSCNLKNLQFSPPQLICL